MPDNIPFEIQMEIIKRLPVKSVLQFRAVSRDWKSLIDSSDFIARYTGQKQHLLVSYQDYSNSLDLEQKFVSFVDDDSFPQQKVAVTLPLVVNMFECVTPVGTSNGLLCWLYDGFIFETGKAVIWNPAIRKAVVVDVHYVSNEIYQTVLGFGVCRQTADPKIVTIKHDVWWKGMGSNPPQVEVFTLSTGAWRSPRGNLPRESICFIMGTNVVIDGVLYWLATDYIIKDDGFGLYALIISIDMTREEFREINLPDSLAHGPVYDYSMSKLRESLVVAEQDVEANNAVLRVWMMEDGNPRSFTKLFTFNVDTPNKEIYISEFKKTGEAIIEIDHFGSTSLIVYDPYSKSINNLEIMDPGSVYSYMETLLLSDHPALTSFGKVRGDHNSSLEMQFDRLRT